MKWRKSENDEKFLKAQDDVLNCLVLSSIKRYFTVIRFFLIFLFKFWHITPLNVAALVTYCWLQKHHLVSSD